MKQGYNTNFFDDYVWNNFIPKDHILVKTKEFINLDFIEPLIKDSYKNDHYAGRDPIDPRTMFLICLLEFIERLSDREAEKKLVEVPIYRWFVDLCPTDKVPDASTISFFRTKRMGEARFKEAFQQIVKQLHEAGLIDGKIQSQDATNIRGDIAILNPMQLLNKCRLNLLKRIKNINKNKYNQLIKKYDFKIIPNPPDKQKYFEELIKTTQGLVAAVKRSARLPKHQTIQKELEILDRVLDERKDEYYDNNGKKQIRDGVEKVKFKMINSSDPDATWGAKSNKNHFAGYKAEINTDREYGIITEVEVNKAAHPEEKAAADLLKDQKDNLGIVPEHFTADAKYDYGNTRAEIRSIQDDPDKKIELYIPLVPTKNKEGGFTLDQFFFEENHLFCPAGYPAEYVHYDDIKMGFEFKFNAAVCNTCELRPQCTKAKYGRRVFVSHTQLFERPYAISFNSTEQYEMVYKEQHWKVEPANADLKRYCGLNRARFRNLDKVRIQAYLAAITYNLKKYFKFIMGKLKNGILTTLSKLPALAPPGGVVCPETG